MSVRAKGLAQFLLSGLVFALVILWFMQQRGANPDFNLPGGPFGILGLCVPGGFALAGLLQAITGAPFSELANRWDALKGWQRGLIGVGVFALGLLLLFGGLVAYGYLTSGS